MDRPEATAIAQQEEQCGVCQLQNMIAIAVGQLLLMNDRMNLEDFINFLSKMMVRGAPV
jgi:hypothetical protein